MPKAKDEKTALVLRLSGLALLVITAVFLIFRQQSPILHLSNKNIKLIEAKTAAQQQQGLSGRSSLPSDQGMLFSFKNVGTLCFWMKDMHFPLDMIWLNSNKRVVHIESNVSPNSFPEKFCPSESAQYVIELNALQSKQFNISPGQTLKF